MVGVVVGCEEMRREWRREKMGFGFVGLREKRVEEEVNALPSDRRERSDHHFLLFLLLYSKFKQETHL